MLKLAQLMFEERGPFSKIPVGVRRCRRFDERQAGAGNAQRSSGGELRKRGSLVEMHGRLLLAADHWQSRGRRRDDLLRNKALKDAEAWLAATASRSDKLPQPTAAETEFILASQVARSRGLRTTIAIATGVIV